MVSLYGFQGTMCEYNRSGGDKEIRTLDPLLARQVLSQLSYTPKLEWNTSHLFFSFLATVLIYLYKLRSSLRYFLQMLVFDSNC